eukprot:s2805_g1.t1
MDDPSACTLTLRPVLFLSVCYFVSYALVLALFPALHPGAVPAGGKRRKAFGLSQVWHRDSCLLLFLQTEPTTCNIFAHVHRTEHSPNDRVATALATRGREAKHNGERLQAPGKRAGVAVRRLFKRRASDTVCMRLCAISTPLATIVQLGNAWGSIGKGGGARVPPSRSASGLQCPFWDMNVDASLTRHIEVLANGWLTASAGRPECANAQLCMQMAQRHLHARSEQHLAVFGSLGGVAQNCACLIGGKGERGSLQSSPCGRRCTQMCERDGTVGPRLCVRIGGGGGPSIEYVAARGGVAVAKVLRARAKPAAGNSHAGESAGGRGVQPPFVLQDLMHSRLAGSRGDD